MTAPPTCYGVSIAGHHHGSCSTFGLVHFNICTVNKVGKLHLAKVSLSICKYLLQGNSCARNTEHGCRNLNDQADHSRKILLATRGHVESQILFLSPDIQYSRAEVAATTIRTPGKAQFIGGAHFGVRSGTYLVCQLALHAQQQHMHGGERQKVSKLYEATVRPDRAHHIVPDYTTSRTCCTLSHPSGHLYIR